MFRWGIGLAVLAVFILRFDLADIGAQLGRTNLSLAIPAIAGLVGMHLLGAATWRLLVIRMTGKRIAWPATVRTYYVAQAVGGLTPGNVGADAYRLYVAGSDGGWRRALAPIVVQRVTSSAALAVLAIAALIALPRADQIVATVAGAAIVLAAASSVVLLVLRQPAAARFSTSTSRQEDTRTFQVTGALATSSALGFMLGLLFHAGSIALSWVLVTAVSPVPNPAPVIASLAVARLSILVPISPSGLGFQEGALSLLFLRIGLPAETALAAALLNRGALLVTGAVGGALLVAGRRGAMQGLTPVPKADFVARGSGEEPHLPTSQAEGVR